VTWLLVLSVGVVVVVVGVLVIQEAIKVLDDEDDE
jgi:hypothetical protein